MIPEFVVPDLTDFQVKKKKEEKTWKNIYYVMILVLFLFLFASGFV